MAPLLLEHLFHRHLSPTPDKARCVCVCLLACASPRLPFLETLLLYNGTGGQFESAVFLMRINVLDDPSVL